MGFPLIRKGTSIRGFQGRNGRLSVQTDPANYRNAKTLDDQAVEFSEMAPNIVAKAPTTKTGFEVIEDATFRSVSMNVAVSPSAPRQLPLVKLLSAP